jgi:hypothetical protein
MKGKRGAPSWICGESNPSPSRLRHAAFRNVDTVQTQSQFRRTLVLPSVIELEPTSTPTRIRTGRTCGLSAVTLPFVYQGMIFHCNIVG